MRRARPTEERGDTDNVGRFAWWAPHDRARHQAEFLLATVATICAAYLAAAIAAVVIALRVGEVGPWRGIATWQHRLGPFGLAGAAVALVVVVAALIALVAWRGLPRRALRLAGARPPAEGEADHARRVLETTAIGLGIETPSLFVVDDACPNGFAVGRSHNYGVCLTSSALALPHEELDALCAHSIISATNRSVTLASAAADLVQIADLCTRVIWGTAALLLLSSLVGVRPEVAASMTIGAVVLVAATQPLLAMARGAIERLLHDATLLADLDTARVTNEPARLARLLLRTAGDDRRVTSRWQIAHVWFDPDTRQASGVHDVRSVRAMSADLARSLMPTHDDVGNAAAHRFLVDRARVIVALTDGDPGLRAQLAELDGSKG